MAEAQLNMYEEIETLTISDIFVMTVDELRNELYKRDKLPKGTANKPSYRWHCLTQCSDLSENVSSCFPVSCNCWNPECSIWFFQRYFKRDQETIVCQNPTELSSGSFELQLQLRRLELEAEREERWKRREAEEQERKERREAEEEERKKIGTQGTLRGWGTQGTPWGW